MPSASCAPGIARANSQAVSTNSSMSSTSITPNWRKTALLTSAEPVNDAVCDCAALRPYYDAAAQERQTTALKNRAELDADAYSRGMGSSTWLSDKKSRESQAAASDIAGIYSQYGAALSEGVSSQMQTYEANRLAVDQQNAANRMSADAQNAANEMEKYKLAYEILLDQINSGAFSTGGGDGGGPDPIDPIKITPIVKDIVLESAGVSAPTFGQKAYLR